MAPVVLAVLLAGCSNGPSSDPPEGDAASEPAEVPANMTLYFRHYTSDLALPCGGTLERVPSDGPDGDQGCPPSGGGGRGNEIAFYHHSAWYANPFPGTFRAGSTLELHAWASTVAPQANAVVIFSLGRGFGANEIAAVTSDPVSTPASPDGTDCREFVANMTVDIPLTAGESFVVEVNHAAQYGLSMCSPGGQQGNRVVFTQPARDETPTLGEPDSVAPLNMTLYFRHEGRISELAPLCGGRLDPAPADGPDGDHGCVEPGSTSFGSNANWYHSTSWALAPLGMGIPANSTVEFRTWASSAVDQAGVRVLFSIRRGGPGTSVIVEESEGVDLPASPAGDECAEFVVSARLPVAMHATEDLWLGFHHRFDDALTLCSPGGEQGNRVLIGPPGNATVLPW